MQAELNSAATTLAANAMRRRRAEGDRSKEVVRELENEYLSGRIQAELNCARHNSGSECEATGLSAGQPIKEVVQQLENESLFWRARPIYRAAYFRFINSKDGGRRKPDRTMTAVLSRWQPE